MARAVGRQPEAWCEKGLAQQIAGVGPFSVFYAESKNLLRLRLVLADIS